MCVCVCVCVCFGHAFLRLVTDLCVCVCVCVFVGAVMCVCELVLACVRVHVRVNVSSLRGFSTSRRPAEGRRGYRKYVFKVFISSRACKELYEVPGGNQVDGLPPAPVGSHFFR